ncbi:MAG: hypothetical protein GVY18_12730 [Bacteroidetes bacterium]|nr:hypothetical protein [Bacteroidota bacterium]
MGVTGWSLLVAGCGLWVGRSARQLSSFLLPYSPFPCFTASIRRGSTSPLLPSTTSSTTLAMALRSMLTSAT